MISSVVVEDFLAGGAHAIAIVHRPPPPSFITAPPRRTLTHTHAHSHAHCFISSKCSSCCACAPPRPAAACAAWPSSGATRPPRCSCPRCGSGLGMLSVEEAEDGGGRRCRGRRHRRRRRRRGGGHGPRQGEGRTPGCGCRRLCERRMGVWKRRGWMRWMHVNVLRLTYVRGDRRFSHVVSSGELVVENAPARAPPPPRKGPYQQRRSALHDDASSWHVD